MTIEVLTLCDFAQNTGNKLNIIGTFNTINMVDISLPFTFYVAVRFRYNKDEIGKKEVTFNVLSPSGEKLIQPLKAVNHVSNNSDEPFVSASLCLCMNNYVFKEFGLHKVTVETEGNIYELPLQVKQIKIPK